MARTVEIQDERIIEVAKKLFLERGIARTEMKDIAAGAGIGRSSLYRHFQSREAIAFHIAVEILEQLGAPLGRDTMEIRQLPWGWDKAGACVRAFVEGLKKEPGLVGFLDEFDQLYSGAYPAEAAASRYIAFVQNRGSCLKGYLQEGLADKSIILEEPPEFVERVLVNTLFGMAQRILPRESHYREEQGYGGELLDGTAALLLEGIRNRSGEK